VQFLAHLVRVRIIDRRLEIIVGGIRHFVSEQIALAWGCHALHDSEMNRADHARNGRFARALDNVSYQLDLRSLEDLRDWVAHGVDFVIIDSETGEDVTRILLA